jgi:hypothetical protein
MGTPFMNELLNSVLQGLITYRIGIFLLLGLGLLIYLRKFSIGLREWQKAIFGLERDLAQRRLISATTGLTLLILLVIGEFLLVTIVGPQIPAAVIGDDQVIETPLSPTEALDTDESTLASTIQTESVDQVSLESECIEGVVEITSPADGETISGTVDIIGSMNIENFGSYKYEYSSAGTIEWITIAAGDEKRLDENLGYWYTSSLTPGGYLLQLVPLNNAGEELTPCIIFVEVEAEE